MCVVRHEALAIFQATFWPMSIGEDSMPELGLKNKYQRRHSKGARRQRANDSRRRLLPEYYVLWLLLHNARIKGMPHLPPHNTPYARGIGRSLTTFTRPHTGANNGTSTLRYRYI